MSITPVVGPEVVSGSTRMKAGTATKMVLNMLSTGAMIRLGKTYGNLMVDLRATNTKLADRARRIVRAVTQSVRSESEKLLRDCGGEVKTAIVSHCTGDVFGTCPATARRHPRPSAQGAAATRRERRSGSALTSCRSRGHAASSNHHVGPSRIGRLNLVLAVDAGGTKTVACLARSTGPLDIRNARPRPRRPGIR